MATLSPSSGEPIAVRYPPHGRRWTRYAGPAIILIVLVILAIIFLIPFYVMIRNALMTQPEITSFSWNWLPASPQWHNATDLFNDPTAPMGAGMKNSAIIAVVSLIFQMLFASMAGYALARIPARGRSLVFALFLSTLMIPPAVTFVPLYAVVDKLGGVNTLWGIIVPGLFNVFAMLLFRQFYLDFPVELEEAATVDGASYYRIFFGLLLPNSKGILMALGALSFVFSWNAFLWPLVIGRNASAMTVQVVMATYLQAQVINLPELFMGAVIAALPLVIVFLIMQRYIAEGVRLSGIKG